MQQLLRTAGARSAVISGLALLAMLLIGPAFARADTSVSVSDNSFSPQTITIAPGDTVTWTNNGTMNHTVTADDSSFSSGTLMPGNSFTHTFNAVGSFPYYCQFHGGPGGVGMSGVIVVSNSASSTNSSTSSTATGTTGTSTAPNATSTNTSTSTDMITSTSTTGTGTSTSTNATSTTAAPVLSSSTAVPNATGATITWTTDVNSDAQVSYGQTANYTTTTASDNTSTTSHSVIIAGLMPGTLYHFRAMSSANGVAGMSPDETFTTTGNATSSTSTTTATTTPSNSGTGTSTATSTDLASLSARVSQLEAFIKTLQQQLQAIFAHSGIPFPPYGGGPMTSTEGTAVYADNYAVAPGGLVHFTGNGFGPDETVNIIVNGMLIGHAHTGSDGSFSISGTAANDAGDTTYWFSGANSGKSDSVMITVITG